MRTHKRSSRRPSSDIVDFKKRVSVTVVALVILSCALVARLIYLQIMRFDHYTVMSNDNRIKLVPRIPGRGMIFDRNGVVLAENYSAYTLELEPPEDEEDFWSVVDRIAAVLAVTSDDRERMREALARRSRFATIAIRSELSDEEAAIFLANAFRFPEVKFGARLYRRYPFGEITSHLLGYVGRVTDQDLKDLERQGQRSNYLRTDRRGKLGIEGYYESALRGKLGYDYLEVNSKGKTVRTIESDLPTNGKNLYLSIDIRLQQAAVEAFGDRRGALVALDPNDGSVLAFVSKPGYDPALFSLGITKDNWNALQSSPDRPLMNRAIAGMYPPGSTIKPFYALAGLESGARTPSWTMSDPGYFTIAGAKHRFRDWKKSGHGVVDTHKAIVESCDTYFYKLANDVGIEVLHDYASRFGFGVPTGLDTMGEYAGLAPNPEWKRKRFGQKWFLGDTISVGIGQGYNLATPTQLAVATAGLANGANLFVPRLVQGIQDNRDQELELTIPLSRPSLELQPENIELIHRAMIDVTRPGGTAAAAAAGANYTLAGKTGTAQVFGLKGAQYNEAEIDERLRDHALFIAYAPAEYPKIALAVLVENGGHGGSAAAPIARKVFDTYLTPQASIGEDYR
ncbi:MAG: penicillin-binding protein 2 [Betaproteobacteria bacterium]